MSKVSYQPLTPLSFLERSASVFRHKPAIVYGEQRWTYAEFADRVQQLAAALQQWGLQPGDRVAFLCPNLPPLLEAHFGVPLAGGILVAMNIRLAPADIGYILQDAGARVLFVESELASAIAPILTQLTPLELVVTIVDEPAQAGEVTLKGQEYEAFLMQGNPSSLGLALDDEETPISINYTSGTGGKPKGVVYTHRGAYLNALGEALEVGMNSESVYLWTLPMFHCNGWCFTWGVVAVGGTHVCLRKVLPNTTITLLMDEGITHFCGAPALLNLLIHDRAIKKLQLRHPLRAVIAGAPPSPTIIQTLEELGIEVTHVYGLTETYGPHSICEWQTAWNALPLEQRARLKARQGVPYIHAAAMRVVDQAMQDVPADGITLGEVVMRGNNVMRGYFNQPDLTREVFRDGWFHSGDLAVMHPDGYIELRDRAKDIVISAGVNISTIEIEQAIVQHPLVFEVAVIAIPDEKRGEVPKAFVTLQPDASLTAKDILDFCRQHLAAFKCPKAIEFGELPKTATGKVQKYLLRDKEWVGYEKRIH
ncbi:MAG: AMP-binding protein [Scytolyngbya sp. HA4215-MV1]|jgi:fatty-acyl-CoA synthase|nr:AMP-binding protein [Scytolyngbya sp. HA4215-MV1]